MNNKRLMIFSIALFIITLCLYISQYFYKEWKESDFSCRAPFNISPNDQYYIGSIQLVSANGKGAAMMLGVYRDKLGNKKPVRIYNELAIKKNGNLYFFQFLKSSIEPQEVLDDPDFTQMLMPYILKGEKRQAIYHIYTQPSGNKFIGIGKIPIVICQRTD